MDYGQDGQACRQPAFIGLRKGCPSSASGVIDSRKPVTNLANFLEAQVAMISPWIRKIKDTLTRTCWRLRCCINRIPPDPGADLLSCTVNLIGDSGHNSGQGCRIGFRLLMQSFRPCQTVQS
jgi:hypothetical protein